MAKALVQHAACQRGGPESGYPDHRPTPHKPITPEFGEVSRISLVPHGGHGP